MFGDNPIRQPEIGTGKILEIQKVFTTIQGEGPYSGRAAVFIRLGGCNLACDFCDTEFESFQAQSVNEVVAEVVERANSIDLIVITGGEPFRQPIELLCTKLLDNDFNVQIETNGTIYRPVDERVDIVCSPKNSGQNYSSIRPDILSRTMAIKFIISASQVDYQDIAEVGQSQYNIPVYLQPMDEHDALKNQANITYTKELVIQRNLRLSLQLHKIMEIQ